MTQNELYDICSIEIGDILRTSLGCFEVGDVPS